MTERAELELFDLLENRTQNLMPTIITTNTTNAQLLAMLSEDRGSAILRRIKDFNTIVKIDK
jgi:DNA replication protein DnaC